ncbi:MAG: PilZ domain-containing protein, partial [Candidatus Brocadiales bacterium]|nr:PilZ domain-containing protein [Candidatus Brocadiales bacterium]
ELLGIEDNQCLLIKMPPIYTVINASKFVYKGKAIFVRYQTKGSVFGFQSNIIAFNSNTEKTISIAYPNEIENYNLRGNKRIDCYLPVNVVIEDHVVHGGIINISEEGCLIVIDPAETESSKDLLKINVNLNMRFQLPGVEEYLHVTAIQKNLVMSMEDIRIGIKFVDMDLKVQAKLHNFIAKAVI